MIDDHDHYHVSISLACVSSETHDLQRVFRPGGGGGTPLYGLYKYVQRQRAWFLAFFVWNRVWFVHSSFELGMFFRKSYFFIIWQ